MRILFNIIFSAILVIGLVGFWALFLNLWKPKKKWPAWVGYIIIIGAWFAAIRHSQSEMLRQKIQYTETEPHHP